jgi:hypothetical protein
MISRIRAAAAAAWFHLSRVAERSAGGRAGVSARVASARARQRGVNVYDWREDPRPSDRGNGRARGMSVERGVDMTQTVAQKKVSFIGRAVTAYQNSDAAVRLSTRCALAALAFPAGAIAKLLWK